MGFFFCGCCLGRTSSLRSESVLPASAGGFCRQGCRRSAGRMPALQGRSHMPTYIALLNWTQQGPSKIRASPKRLDAGRKAFKKVGAEIKDVYLTMCRHDMVCVIEAPDDESYAKALLGL